MLVHPSTADAPLRGQTSQLLSRVLDVASPRTAKLDIVWTFGRKRKRRSDDDSDDEEEPCELEKDSLFNQVHSVWDVIEWAFIKGEGGWTDLLNHLLRVIRNDFEECKRRAQEILEASQAIGNEHKENPCIFTPKVFLANCSFG